MSRERSSVHRFSDMNVISVDTIINGLGTHVVGNEIVYFDVTNSTNDEAKRLAETGAVEGTAVIARTQTKGKGRLNREWFSPEGGIWMSLILRPSESRPLQKLTLLAGLSVAETLRTFSGIQAYLKWPNDVMVEQKKICGILCEGSFTGEKLNFVIVGIGINVNVDTSTFPGRLKSEATSVKKVLTQEVPINDLIRGLLRIFDQNYRLFVAGEDKELLQRYTKLSSTIGARVKVETGEGETLEGIAEGISPDGGLVLRTKKGTKETILTGSCCNNKSE